MSTRCDVVTVPYDALRGEKQAKEWQMKTKPINRGEQAWINRAQEVFRDAPDRFAFMTIGDRCLEILDHEGAKKSDLHDGLAHRAGIVLGHITTKNPVHGVSG
tara:strand:+ start:264 stop:572 length:309 start_codon:yes stop_codon:yes gene_type:complete